MTWEQDSWQKSDEWWKADDQQQQSEWKTEDAVANADPWAADTTQNTQEWKTQESSWGQPDEKPAAPQAKAFWETQEYNKQNGILPRKEDWELDQIDQENWVVQNESDISLYDNVPVDLSGSKSSAIPVLSTFEELYQTFGEMIPDALVNNVRKVGYTRPTPVQRYALPCGLVGRDIMCCAQTGSGKTAAFLLPIIGRMMKVHESPVGLMDTPFEGKCSPDTLIMTPTRELCIQIHEEAQKFCHRTPYRCCRVYGGEQTKIQLEDLAKGCDLMVACPGRLADFIGREVISVEKVYILVLDEADRMLDMGFEKSIRAIVEEHGMNKKEERQTMMFSATFPEDCQKMAQDYLYDYIWIGVGIIGSAVESVAQSLVQVPTAKKFDRLLEVLDDFLAKDYTTRVLVFARSKNTAKWLDEQLYAKNMQTAALHGDLEQHERETNLNRYRKGEVRIMVATDVAARGLDIEKIALVVNYDMPDNVDTYVHRIGRSGRIGNRGEAITFCATDDSGASLEDVNLMKKLHGIVRDAKSDVPDWLEHIVEGTAGGSNEGWSNWGGRDMRGGWGTWDKKEEEKTEEKQEESKWGNESWNNNDDNSWKKEEWQ